MGKWWVRSFTEKRIAGGKVGRKREPVGRAVVGALVRSLGVGRGVRERIVGSLVVGRLVGLVGEGVGLVVVGDVYSGSQNWARS